MPLRMPATTVAALAVALAGCATSTVTQTFRDPGYEARPVKRVLVVGLALRDETLQDSFENAFATALRVRGYDATTTSSVFQPWELDEETLVRYVKDNGFDLVVQLALVSRTDSALTPATVQLASGIGQASSPAPYAAPQTGNSAGGSTYGFAIVRQPGQVATDTEVSAEIKVFSVPKESLVWTGMSRTFHAQGDVDVAESLATALLSDLRKAGILPR